MRLTSPVVAALAATLAPVSSAASLQIQIPSSNILPNPNLLPASTHATLTSSQSPALQASLRRGNSIDFSDISSTGTHLLDIFSRDYTFAPYRVDIDANGTISAVYETYRGTQWSDHGLQLIAAPSSSVVVQAKVLSRKNFYDERQGFSPMSLLKNPMILLGVVAIGFTFGMPKLMENMDPESKAEFEEMQKNSPVGGIMGAMQGQSGAGPASNFDLAGWMAGAPQQNNAQLTTKTTATDAGANGIRERRRG